MPDTIPPATPAAPAPAADNASPKPHGYFNQAQLEDIALAEAVVAAARSHPADLATRDITAAYLDGLADAIRKARDKTTETGQATDGSGAATINAGAAERALVTALQGIQIAAKQKHRMLAEDDDPTTNFSTDGYFIGLRLNPNRATLLQNAAALLAKVKTDALPGYKTPESIDAIETALGDYTAATAGQQGSEEERGTDRQQRDALIKKINTRRLAIQHAADALYPFTDETRRPQRKSFQLPLSRPLAG